MLQIVLVAARPLTLVEMDVAFHLDDRTLLYAELEEEGPDRLRETLSSRCGLIVTIIEDKVYFIHQTVKEFLLRKDGIQHVPGRIWQQSLDSQESHGVLAKVCLQNLSWREINIDQTNHLNALLPDYHRREESNAYCRQFKFLSYSVTYWADHYRDSRDDHKCNQVVKSLLWDNNQRVDVGRYGSDCVLAIYAASLGGHQDIVQILLDQGADVDVEGGEYSNALQAASLEGHQEIVQILLDKGADINAQGGYYGNALQAASSGGHQEIVRMLLDKGADVNAEGGRYGNALQAASSKGHQDIVRTLLNKGAY